MSQSNALRVTTVQTSLHWEAIDKNLNHFENLLDRIQGQQDIIVLPEMFSTGFTMNTEEVAESMDGKSVQWMRGQAEKLKSVLCGSLILKDGGEYYNRFIWMKPDGEFQFYDKKHLFTLAGEHEYFKPGDQKIIIDYKGWKICPLICYDLRFPVWARNVENYDLLIYVANWPKPRANAWRALLTARAIENQCYVVGVNRVGADEKGLDYIGDTMVVDFLGNTLYHTANIEQVSTTELNLTSQNTLRSKLNFLADQDGFQLK